LICLFASTGISVGLPEVLLNVDRTIFFSSITFQIVWLCYCAEGTDTGIRRIVIKCIRLHPGTDVIGIPLVFLADLKMLL
jgi:hypothetical protein